MENIQPPLKIINKENEILIYDENSKKFHSLHKMQKYYFQLENITSNQFMENSKCPIHLAYSIVGLISCKIDTYLIYVSEVEQKCEFFGNKIFQVKKFKFLPLNLCTDIKEDFIFLKMISNFLHRNTLFYSPTLDLTLKIKEIYHEKKEISNKHFFWNYKLKDNLSSFFNFDNFEFIPSIINGYFGGISYETFSFFLIARKDVRRSGMRFFVRGGDLKGNCANFVETEQVLITEACDNNKNIISYIQLRGSIPLLWNQYPELNSTPRVKVNVNTEKNFQVFKNHVDKLQHTYKKILAINLVCRKREKILGEFFSYLSSNYKKQNESSFDYVWFDYNKECGKVNYQNINNLFQIHKVENALNNDEFTHIKLIKVENGGHTVEILSLQEGCIRTNCIDCLDRTNIVQTLFARQNLLKILYKLKLKQNCPNGNPFEKLDDETLFNFEDNFNRIWSEHGDHLSQSYAGTLSLSSELIRTGQRTRKGMLKDGITLFKRFYINNFKDGYHQDCHDYFIGKLKTSDKNFIVHSRIQMFPIVIFIVFLISTIIYLFLTTFALKSHQNDIYKLLFKFLIFSSVSFLTFKSSLRGMKGLIINQPAINHGIH
jgi:hypothetical protein